MRLKSSFSDAGYSAQGKLFIKALKKYGLIFADQGTGIFVSGTSSDSWDSNFLDEINQPNSPPVNNPQKRIHISNFEIVQSPNPVVYRFSGTPTCGGKTDNNPSVFVPNFKPVCKAFDDAIAGGASNVSFSFIGMLLVVAIVFLY
jgi:hypothetical protein